jgi:hypothetical protein
MRLHYGSIPETAGFEPEADGWRTIREPGPIALQVIAIPIATALALVWAICVLSFRQTTFLSQGVTIDISTLLLLILIVPVHELLHAVVHPGWGLSTSTIIGIWLSKGLFYAHYTGEMSRNRFLLVLVMPFLVLGVLPTVLIMLMPGLRQSLLWLSLFGSVFACGDLEGVGFILFQIPSSAIVRNQGWKTYWKSA